MSDDLNSGKITLDDLPISRDRDAAWRQLREHGRTVLLDGGLAATDVDTVEAVLRQPTIFSSKKAFDVLGSPLPLVPIAFDPPDQTRYRRILQPFFSPRAIRPLEEELRRQIIEIIEPLVQRGSCEYVSEVAGIFPVQVFLTLFGLPLEMRDQFIEWKDAILGLSDPSGNTALDEAATEAAMATALGLFGYLSDLVPTRRGVAGDDVLSQLLCLAGEEALTDEEAVGLCFLFVLAGLDTVVDALSFGMDRLIRNPDRRREIVDDPALIPAAIEELLRLDPPAPFVPRVTTEETVLDGRTLPAGTRVTTNLAAANRDETRHPDPYTVNFHRGESPHLSFGAGVHRCLGSHLARLEMRLVFEEWHRLIPDYDLAPGASPQVKWPRGTLGLDVLPLVFPASAGSAGSAGSEASARSGASAGPEASAS
ncbi:cytochrome P450 [Frankia sp. QA3]|uniref:cytochrome P450 n=1 Tax=Frankia sp. QA3 TaxID=710111 RepID=UPI000269CE5F|nr:cytochrome P450 [Frankia sp. QA3]EIV96202.1 cytochrome P450 [Frankia sp. QA3]